MRRISKSCSSSLVNSTWAMFLVLAVLLNVPRTAAASAPGVSGQLHSPQIIPTQPASASAPDANHVLFLPAIANGNFRLTETIQIDHQAASYQALDGILTLTFPYYAVSGPRVLTITSSPPESRAELIHIEITLFNAYTGQEEYDLRSPVTIQFNYAGMDLSFIPEADLAITSYTEVLPTTVDTVQHTASATTNHFSPFSLTWPPQQLIGLSGMAAGKSGNIFVLAPPILYQVPAGSTTLQKLVDLSTIAPQDEKFNYASRLAYNPTADSLYLSIGSHNKVYALEGNTLRTVYTTPSAGETVVALAYRSSDNSLFVATSVYNTDWWGNRGHIVRVNPVNGAVLTDYDQTGTVPGDIAVNSSGTLATSTKWGCTGSDVDNDPYEVNGHTFIGARYLASDANDNIYVANSGGNAISVLSGPSLTISGVIRVPQPTALAVSGGRILVVSEGRIREISAQRRDLPSGGAVISPGDTLSGKGNLITVQSAALDRIPAHNILTYNGVSLAMPLLTSCDLSAQPASYSFAINPVLPDPLKYVPVNAQKAHLVFSVAGAQVAETDVGAPEMPVIQLPSGDSTNITLTRGQWVKWTSPVQSLDDLFDPQPSGSLYQFNALGTFQFQFSDRTLNITVAPFSAPEEGSANIRGSVGGVVWASGAAFEIPAGALPGSDTVYAVTFNSVPYNNPSQDNPTSASPLYHFSITPEPTTLAKALLVHLPYDPSGDQPTMAFFDPEIQDSILLESKTDTVPGYLLFTIPAGNYPASTAAAGMTGEGDAVPTTGRQPNQPQATKPSLFRRSLNWLGSTGVWHGVGLPNTNLQTDNFMILFHTNDCTEHYASILLDALEDTMIEFTNQGYQIPSTQVIVKIAPWIASKTTPGVTPGIGSLYNYYMFMNNQLSTADLQDTAAHEYFHILQKENASAAGRYQDPEWFEEATATWAQYVVYPSHQGFFADAQAGMSFPNVAFNQWDSLGYQQQYAAMAMIVYLEKEAGQGAVKTVLNSLGVTTDIREALDQVTGGWEDFYGKFAKDYWLQKFAPVNQWTITDVGAGLATFNFTQASNSRTVGSPALSSGLIKAYWNSTLTPSPPASFTTGTNSSSYIKNATSCNAREIFILDKSKQELGSFIGNVEANYTVPLSKLGDYTNANPVYFLTINSSAGSSNPSCGYMLVVDEPTAVSLSPSSVKVNQPAQITVTGDGFGEYTGNVYAGGATYTPTDWGPGAAIFTLPGQTTPGTINVRVQLPNGALSNPLTLTLSP